MKYSLLYKSDKPQINNDDVAEVRIEYAPDFEQMQYFFSCYPTKTFAIEISMVDLPTLIFKDLNSFVSAIKDYNVKLSFSFPLMSIEQNEELTTCINKLKELNIPFFSSFCATNKSMLSTLAILGVSDIYVSGELAMELESIPTILETVGAKRENITIKALANLPQGDDIYSHDIVKFFIRPEDVSVYDGYIDILELTSLERESNIDEYWYYDIYHKGHWSGTLGDILIKCGEELYEIDNNKLPPRIFGQHRINCKKRCLEGKCHRCVQYGLAAALLKINNVSFVNSKEYKDSDFDVHNDYIFSEEEEERIEALSVEEINAADDDLFALYMEGKITKEELFDEKTKEKFTTQEEPEE